VRRPVEQYDMLRRFREFVQWRVPLQASQMKLLQRLLDFAPIISPRSTESSSNWMGKQTNGDSGKLYDRHFHGSRARRGGVFRGAALALLFA
jgi:hypothetical protein